MIKIYGIPNCDTMKKARKWLENNNLEYEFHDYKKHGVPETNLKQWVKTLSWETVLNRRGTTWRKLDASIKDNIDEKSAIDVMLNNPSAIKRPIIEKNVNVLAGFNEKEYTILF